MNIHRINSGLLTHLITLSEDCNVDKFSLIAVYSILKKSKGNDVKYLAYKAKNGKTVRNFNLLRSKTNLSLSTLKKYVPILVSQGLCWFDPNGDFIVLGNKKCKNKYKSIKLIPIIIGKNITETKYNVMSVFLKSNQTAQEAMIQKKRNRSVILSRMPRNKKEMRIYKKYSERGVQLTDKCVLSNMGFANVLKKSTNNKSLGSYYKNKLIEKNIITSERRFKYIKSMSYSEYLNFKKFGAFKIGMTYNTRGYLAIELSSSFSCINNISRN